MANFAAKNQKPGKRKFKSERWLNLIYYQLNKYATKLMKFLQVAQVYSVKKLLEKRPGNREIIFLGGKEI